MSFCQIARRLGRLDLAAVRQAALAAAAETIAAELRASLTGALAGSIGVTTDGDTALVGSTSEAALTQERGTAKTQPLSIFGAIGPDHAEAAATAVGAAVADAIRSA